VKYVVLESFRADYKRLSAAEQDLFKKVMPDVVAACDRRVADPAASWPAALRVKSVEGAPGIWEMTWSFRGPDGRATFEWVQIDQEMAVRWRRIGGHSIFKQP
jgi:hypothetical protein